MGFVGDGIGDELGDAAGRSLVEELHEATRSGRHKSRIAPARANLRRYLTAQH
jgi:hypothetical protein